MPNLLFKSTLFLFVALCCSEGHSEQKDDAFLRAFARASELAWQEAKAKKLEEMQNAVDIVRDISEGRNVSLRRKEKDDSKNEPRLSYSRSKKTWSINVVNRRQVEDEIEKQQNRYYKIKAEIAEATGYSVPRFDVNSLSVGSLGVPSDDGSAVVVKVSQVLGADRALIDRDENDFILEGVDFSSIADNDRVSLTHVCICEKNETFATVLGAKRTVPVLRVINKTQVDEAVEYCLQHPIERKKEYRVWKDTSGSFQVEAEFVFNRKGKVTLRKTDGKEIEVSISKLSPDDRKFLKDNGDPW